jgi:outer membrane protein
MRFNNIKLFYLLSLIVLFSNKTIAFESVEPEDYDLVQSYKLGLENDPTLKANRSAFQGSLEFKTQARGALLPKVDISASTTRSYSNNASVRSIVPSPDITINQSLLSANQPIYHHELWLDLENAELKREQAQATLLAAEQNLIMRIAERYFGVLEAKDALHFTSMQTKAFNKHLEQTQQRFDVGLIAITDVHEAKARRDSAIASELSAQNDLADQLELLREIIGIPAVHLKSLKANFPLISPKPSKEEKWVELTLSKNAQLSAARFSLELAKRDILQQRAQHFPKIDLNASLREGNSRLGPSSYLSTTASFSISMPIFSGGAIHSRTMQAKANFEEKQHNYDQALRSAMSQSRQAYRGVLTQISSVKALAQAVLSNKSALEATEAAYEVGTRTIVDVLDSQSSLISAERDHAKARYNYILNSLRLKLFAGTLNEEDLDLINASLS